MLRKPTCNCVMIINDMTEWMSAGKG